MAPHQSAVPLTRLYYEIYPNCQPLTYPPALIKKNLRQLFRYGNLHNVGKPYRFGDTFVYEYVDGYKVLLLDSIVSFTYSPVFSEQISIFE